MFNLICFHVFTGQIAADFKSSYTFLVLKHSSAINFLMMLKNTVVLVDYNSLGPLFNNCIQSSSLDTSKIQLFRERLSEKCARDNPER